MNINYIKENLFTVIAIILSCFAIVYCGKMALHSSSFVGRIMYLVCIGFICKGNFVYFITRLGYLRRHQQFSPILEKDLQSYYEGYAPTLTILIPSYKEELDVVKQTLFSSALQDYPNRRVVLLIDDPQYTDNKEEMERLEATRSLPKQIEDAFAPMLLKLRIALAAFLKRKETSTIHIRDEHQILSNLHRHIVNWFTLLAKQFDSNSHIEKTFVSLNLTPRINKHMEKEQEALSQSWSLAEMEWEYRYLIAIFNVELSYFERKKYQNLSHASNKAMNLNSYLSVMGKSYVEEQTEKGLILREEVPEKSTLHFSNSDFVAMLDADTILSHHYAIQLIHLMSQPEHQKLAVIQTPYSAFPNSPNTLERIAGATTDVLYITHQGFTFFNATFWVGANALVRKNALDDIVETTLERGYTLTKYIQDRTVIEDTESSVDLVNKGWKLYNYPERLSYSATPHDFGSLLIQRRRWANGGLLILPKLFGYLFKNPWSLSRFVESVFRFHYLFSLTAMMFVVPVLTIFSFISSDYSEGAILISLPYFWLYGRDLSHHGYSFFDIFKVVSLNLLLFPINCAGVIKSMHQAWTGKHTPFCRTPKVAGRTSVPKIYNILTIIFVGWALVALVWNIIHGGWIQTALFCLFMVFPILYGTVAFMGWKNMLEDCQGLKAKAQT